MAGPEQTPARADSQERVTAIGLTPKSAGGMQYRHVGRSGLVASALGVGCFPFGGFVDQAGAAAVVDQALDLGINYFDTANSYGLGRSETCLGQALVGKRQRAVIATKFGNRMGDGANDAGASRLAIVNACEASLKRLQTDSIDLYQLHWPDRATPIDETMRALDDLVRAGKVRYVGCSNLFEWEIAEANGVADRFGWPRFVSAQDFHNLLYRDIEKRMEPYCVKAGVGMTAYFPLAGGLLANAYPRVAAPSAGTRQANNPNTPAWQSDRNWNVQERLDAFARERGWTLAQMAIAWLLARPATFTVIAGADEPKHLLDNVKALDIRFSADDLVEIDRLTLVDEDRSVAPVYRTLRPEKVHEFATRQAAASARKKT